MKKCSLLAVVSMLAFLQGCSKPESPQAPAEQGLASGPAPRLTARKACPVDLPRPSEGNPQSPFYSGGCLEAFSYFEGELKDGKPTELRVRARFGAHDAQSVEVVLEEAGAFKPRKAEKYSPEGRSVPLYIPRYNGINLCEGEPYRSTEAQSKDEASLQGKAIVVPGHWDSGRWHASDKTFTVSCFTGVVAKCAYWGYIPWAAYEGVQLGKHHQACVGGARADYADSLDMSYTCEQTVIDIYDNLGILEREEMEGFALESVWNAQGPVCITRPRWDGCTADLQNRGARLRQDCESVARNWSEGALIVVRSHRENRALANGTGPVTCPTIGSNAVCPVSQ